MTDEEKGSADSGLRTAAGEDKSDEPQAAVGSPQSAALDPTDDFMLAGEKPETMVAPAPAPPPALPSPAEAALKAASLVSQMVDIESESGAVIAAAAAAGAAIEAANAAMPPSEGGDPMTTVKLSRDRILRALHEEVAPEPPKRESRTRLESTPGEGAPRATTADDAVGPEQIDPVAIAAAAIARLRRRARTDFAELRTHYHRHDIVVLVIAFVMIVAAGRLHARLVTPPTQPFAAHGLSFEHSAAWLAPEPLAPPPPRLVRDLGPPPSGKDELYSVAMTSTLDPSARIEVVIDKKPAWSNIVAGLELDRRTRWGELYKLDDSSVVSIEDYDWLRTSYRYAHAAEKGDVPRVDRAIEFATIDRDQIYVVTLFGTAGELERIEDVVRPSLRVQSRGLPLVPQTSRISRHAYPNGVERAFDSTVMIVVADLVDGRLRARGGGSGVIVGGDGSILTNYHVIHDKNGRLHDVFVVGRFTSPDGAPTLQCAGRPSRSKLQPELDLALLKCDLDLDGRAWNPANTGVWATLPDARKSDVAMGQRLWVLGYPDVAGGGLTLSEGEVEGWTGDNGAETKEFIKTDASITRGNSGGPVVDDQGQLVGIASAVRATIAANGSVIESPQPGIVRPISAANCLLDVASTGWTPREGHTSCDLAPGAIEAAPEGVRIFTTVLDSANEAPIRDALVMVLRKGVSASSIDTNRLDDQAIAWGKTNAQGEVRLKQLVPVPGDYTVMVIAPGYEPLVGGDVLSLKADTPRMFDPWGGISLNAR